MFEYFSTVQFLRAFHDLNTCVDNLIFTHFRTNRLVSRAVSKQEVDIVCRVNLPLITDRIVLVSLSNADEIPQQISLSLSFL